MPGCSRAVRRVSRRPALPATASERRLRSAKPPSRRLGPRAAPSASTPDAPAPRQRPDPRLPGRNGWADRRQLRRLALGALGHTLAAGRPARRLLPVLATGAVPRAGSAPPSALVRGRLHRDVHARRLGAHPRQHALPLDLRQQRGRRARPRALPALVRRRRARRVRAADVRDVALLDRSRGERAERRRQRRDRRRPRRVLHPAAAREGADLDRLLPARDPGLLVPWNLVRLPGAARQPGAAPPGAGWRRGLLRACRRLRLRRADGEARPGPAAAAPDLLMRFEDHVSRALASLPPQLQQAVRNLEIDVEEQHPEDPDLFGLYEGVPLPERGDWAGGLPDRIRIFRQPLVEEFGDDPAVL